MVLLGIIVKYRAEGFVVPSDICPGPQKIKVQNNRLVVLSSSIFAEFHCFLNLVFGGFVCYVSLGETDIALQSYRGFCSRPAGYVWTVSNMLIFFFQIEHRFEICNLP